MFRFTNTRFAQIFEELGERRGIHPDLGEMAV
jgi:hypothetical protein